MSPPRDLVTIYRLEKIFWIPLAVIVVLIARLVRPWLLIRWGGDFHESKLGHLALNTELYLCEHKFKINTPESKYLDLPYLDSRIVANKQLFKMFKRTRRFYPHGPLSTIKWLNDKIPSGRLHNIPSNTNSDKDINNLLVRIKPHLTFTQQEKENGEAFLKSLGILPNQRYICLSVRDNAFGLSKGFNTNKHQYRNSDIDNFVFASEEIASQGYFVLRMGREVEKPLRARSPRVIDYAYERLGNDFFDVYLGAHCYMCLSTGNGYDTIPATFRRPVSFVNILPVDGIHSSAIYKIYISKSHFDADTGEELTLRQIIAKRLAWRASTSVYQSENIVLRENNQKEIFDVLSETIARLDGNWKSSFLGEKLQSEFKKIITRPSYLLPEHGNMQGRRIPAHGDFQIRYSESYLLTNSWWLK